MLFAAEMRAAGVASSAFMTATRVSSAASVCERASERRSAEAFVMCVSAFRARAQGARHSGGACKSARPRTDKGEKK
jgi:exo-beta-1,3-glucanase (GH17 family)